MSNEPKRVIPPAAPATAPTRPAPPRSRPSPAKDFPPLALIFMGFLFGAIGGVLLVLGPLPLKAVGVVLAVLGQVFLLIGVIAQGVYIGAAKARDRGLLN